MSLHDLWAGKIKQAKEKWDTFSNWFKNKIEEVFQSKKKTFLFLALIVFTVLFGIQIAIILINNSFYSNFSDDILQYYTIIVDFISQIKSGSMSFFNLNNYLGASFFSDVYYVPIDIFTFITFVFSYLMPTQLAYSVTEFVKILAGVMVLAYYLSAQGMKNRTIFWMGIVYFVSGGTVSFMAFPAFLSLVFYLPLGLLVIHWFFKGKKWIVPLFALALVFYNFYLAYTALIFVGIMFIIEYIKRPEFRFFPFLKDGIVFLFLLLLGVGMSLVILYPSILFILEDTYRETGRFSAWIVNIGSYQLKLFKPEIYIRFLAKIFAEQRPIGFYGFAQDYTKEHISLFITMTGLVSMSYVIFMKDKISKIYKIVMIIGVILMFFPIFSYVFSGTTDQPYTRWINTYPLVMVLILAHVFEHHGFENFKMKYLTIPISIFIALDGYLIYYYFHRLRELGDFQYEDALTADAILMGVSAVVLVLLLIFGWMKKPQVFKKILLIEAVIGLVYIYSGAFYIRNKNTTFAEMYAINDLLNEVLDDKDEFYRVYVDLDRFNVERTNFNRMTTFPTNTRIFHSWTDSETDLLARLLFGSTEHQTKEALDVQAIYLNEFLGYKYVLASSEYNYYLDNDFYRLVYADDKYQLLEIVNAKSIQVYESYAENVDFTDYRLTNNKLETQKILVLSALIDAERYADYTFNLEKASLTSSSSLGTISADKGINLYETVAIGGITDQTERDFFRFSNENLNIGFDVGAIYISAYTNASNYKEIFMEYADGSKKACEVVTGQSHDVKCEFWSEPTAIYFESENLSANFHFDFRLEMARDQAAYLVYDLSEITYTGDKGVLYFELSQKFERVFFVDENGNEYEGFKNYYYFNSAPIRMYVFKTYDMYTNVSNLFTFNLRYAYDDLSAYDNATGTSLYDQELISIKHGKINLQYHRTSESTYDQLVVIPVAYSEEWTFISDQKYETISASGGFLGIIIPNGINDIDIELRFVPKGLLYGALASLGASLVYLGLFVPGWIIKYKQKKAHNQIKEMNQE